MVEKEIRPGTLLRVFHDKFTSVVVETSVENYFSAGRLHTDQDGKYYIATFGTLDGTDVEEWLGEMDKEIVAEAIRQGYRLHGWENHLPEVENIIQHHINSPAVKIVY
jgi:hypothetical protein